MSPARVGVLLADSASAPGFRSGRRLHRVAERDGTRGVRGPLLIVSAASMLPAVAEVAGDAHRQHRLKGLLIRQDVGTGLIAPMLDRAGLRIWRGVLVHQGPPLPARVLEAWEMGAENELIAEASVTGGVLFLLSCALERLEVPVRKISVLARMRPSEVTALEVSADGSYVHWPRGDVHLDLGSLRYVVDPEWRARTDAERVGQHERFGEAVRAVREAHGLTQGGIRGLSARHLRRVEAGLFPKVATLRVLARAHGMELDRYLTAVAEAAREIQRLASCRPKRIAANPRPRAAGLRPPRSSGSLKNWVGEPGKVLPVRLPVAKIPASLRSPVTGLIQVAFADLASILSRWRKTVVGLAEVDEHALAVGRAHGGVQGALAADARGEDALVGDEGPPREVAEDLPHQADLGGAGGVERLVPAGLHAPHLVLAVGVEPPAMTDHQA